MRIHVALNACVQFPLAEFYSLVCDKLIENYIICLLRYLLPAGLERLLEGATGTNVDLKQATKLALDVSFFFVLILSTFTSGKLIRIMEHAN